MNRKRLVPIRGGLADWFVVAVKLLLGVVGVERRARSSMVSFVGQPAWSGRNCMGELKLAEKSFDISKVEVVGGLSQVRANRARGGGRGEPGGVEADLKDNLYRIWNRMSSGSYFPPPVRAGQIAKAHGTGTRTLGVPTVADRVAQTVVANRLAERSNRSSTQTPTVTVRAVGLGAVAVCQQRCWKHDWVIRYRCAGVLRQRGLDLMLSGRGALHRAVVLLYVTRWLACPASRTRMVVCSNGSAAPRKGPRLAGAGDLFLHYAFDCVNDPDSPGVEFER